MDFQHIMHAELPILRDSDQLPEPLDEEVQATRFKALIGQGVWEGK